MANQAAPTADHRADDELLALLDEWVKTKAEYFRFGREEYAHKVSPLYAKEHNLSPDDASSLQTEVRERLEKLSDAEHKAQWALYSTVRKRQGGTE